MKVSLSTRCLVVAIAQVCTTSSHPDPPGCAPPSDPLSPSSPPVETGRRGDPQKGNSYTLNLCIFAPNTVWNLKCSYRRRDGAHYAYGGTYGKEMCQLSYSPRCPLYES